MSTIFHSFKVNTHVHCPAPILHRGNTRPPSSAASPPSAGRPWWARRPARSRSRARLSRSEPRSPPPRTPPCSTGGPCGTHPAREPRHSANTNKHASYLMFLQLRGHSFNSCVKEDNEIQTLLLEIQSLVQVSKCLRIIFFECNLVAQLFYPETCDLYLDILCKSEVISLCSLSLPLKRIRPSSAAVKE